MMTPEDTIKIFAQTKPDDILKQIGAFFQPPIIPAYLPSEMLTAACYRALGYAGMKDIWISQNGKALTKLFLDNLKSVFL